MPTDRPNRVIVFCDGSADNVESRIGAWAAILQYSNAEKVIVGSELETTSSRMELEAASQALESLLRPCAVTVHSDSQYLVRGAQGRSKKLSSNHDLWARIFEQKAKHNIEWSWCEGHAGVQANERVHDLAITEFRRRLKEEQDKKPAEVLDLNEARERIKAAEEEARWPERSRYLAETFADGDPELITYHRLLPFICDWKDVDPPKIVVRGRKGILLNVLGSRARVVFDDAPPDEEFSTKKEKVPASEVVDAGEVRPLVYTSRKREKG